MTLAVGAVLGRYRIDAELGGGGMGTVFRAFDTHLARAVAIKVLHAEGRASAELLREARSAAALHHPNAVAIHDVAEIDGVPVLVMELVEGIRLRDLIGADTPVATRVRWLTDLAGVLAAAHRRGIVHRDIKPDNVMVATDGVLKVLDFGIAKVIGVRADGPTIDDAFRTAVGATKGTPAYMAPEQLEGQAVDGRADQYAWGVTAYELLAGVHPVATVPGATPTEVTLAIHPPPLSELAPALPGGLSPIVARAMAKRPEARFATMDDVVRALGADAAAGPDDAAPTARDADARSPTVATGAATGAPRGGSLRPRWIALAAVIAVGGAIAVWAAIASTRSGPRPTADDRALTHGSASEAGTGASGGGGATMPTAADAATPLVAGPGPDIVDAAPVAIDAARSRDTGGTSPPKGTPCHDLHDCDVVGAGELCRDGTCVACPPGTEPAMGPACGTRCTGASDCPATQMCATASLVHKFQSVCVGCAQDHAFYAGVCRPVCPSRACEPPYGCVDVRVAGTTRSLCLPGGSDACAAGTVRLPGGTCGRSCRDSSDCPDGHDCRFEECT